MGHDKSEERSGQIAFWAVLSTLTLAGLVPFFNWYFNSMTDTELSAKVNSPDRDRDGTVDYLAERNRQLDEARSQIEGAPVSISAAIDQLASSGRNVDSVRPRRNDGPDTAIGDALASLAAVEGWSQRTDEEGKADAEHALLRRRAVGIMQRLSQAAVQATDEGRTELATEANALRIEARNADAETLTRAEEWLAAWPRRGDLAASPE